MRIGLFSAQKMKNTERTENSQINFQNSHTILRILSEFSVLMYSDAETCGKSVCVSVFVSILAYFSVF